MPDAVHTGRLPDGRAIGIRELRMDQYEQLAQECARDCKGDAVAGASLIRTRTRERCVVQVGEFQASAATPTRELVAMLSTKDCQLVDSIIDRIHCASAAEAEDFWGTFRAAPTEGTTTSGA
jgi:hypothetical protein